MSDATPELALPPETLAALKKKHVEFLEARLTGEAARDDWTRSFRAGYAWALGLELKKVVDPEALTDGIVKALTENSVKRVFAPVMRDLNRRVLRSLRKDDAKLGDYVPKDARVEIDGLLERPDLVPARIVRRVFEQEAIEDAIRDMLYDGLKEFNETVNPFFADWGLPALLKRMPIGGGAVMKSLGAMRGEFDKRLDPEIKKFLLAFSRKAKEKLAETFVTKQDDPKVITLRKNVVAALYEESLAELLAGIDDAAAAKTEIATEHVVLATLRSQRPKERLRQGIAALLEEHGDGTVGDWLRGAGVTEEPDLDAWAALLWPHVERALASPVSRAFFEKITSEFYDGLGG
ncbi:MAG: hypothetical protein KF819_39650 [Labilithrix sp.]|nr:hypothetical protein [Labilithrix sp.]